ncbi:MAG: hypothetical protein II388_11060 [Clostridia bacterium]|nr:hypothetical protein [Clostridia bacterium]
MGKGWIKIDRQIQEHWIWTDKPFNKSAAWIDLILLANHETQKVNLREGLVTVRRGQFVTGIDKLAERWGWSRGKVYRFLKVLETEQMLKRKTNTYGTLLTIVNYGKFQGVRNTNETPNGTTDGTTDETTDGTPTRKNKNDKEIKESAAQTLDESLALQEEKPPVPGAVKLPGGGWNYSPGIDWGDDD